jgi:PAS domain S-box-containing protein
VVEETFGWAWGKGSASREGELHFRRLLDKLPAGAYTCEPGGLITYYNQHAVELWGRAPKLNDPVDRFCGSFKLFATDGSPISHDRCWMARALQTDEGYNRREIVIERPGGERRTALAHANPVHDDSGRLIGAVNVLVDITDRKRAEEALRETREQERRRIARDLHDSVLQELAYAAQTIELAKLEVEGTGPVEGLREGADAIRHAAMELRGIVYDLRLMDEDHPLPDLLDSVVERSRGMARGCEIRLNVEEGFPPTPLGGVGVEMLHIIGEALANARRHSEAENVVVTLSARNGHLMAEVSDDGRGFGPETVAGVGLGSMRERAAALGGELEVESVPGEGTRVCIRVRTPEP